MRQHVCKANATVAFAVEAADLDGDSDFDVLSTFLNGDIIWYETLDGTGNFSPAQRVFTSRADEACSVAATDLDGNGDLDLLSALHGSKIAGFVNLDGAGHFSGP